MKNIEVVKWSEELVLATSRLPRGSLVHTKMKCLLCGNRIGVKGTPSLLKDEDCPWCGKKLIHVIDINQDNCDNTIDPYICDAIRIALYECRTRGVSTSAFVSHLKDKIVSPITLPVIEQHLNFLEKRREIAQVQNRDNPSKISWTLTEAGRIRVIQSDIIYLTDNYPPQPLSQN